MSFSNLDRLENLLRIGQLDREPAAEEEIEGLLHSGQVRLKDARSHALSLESRFDLAYNAAHALALLALRCHGYRPKNRYLAFQTLSDTLGLEASKWRVLDRAHRKRNLAEYEGDLEIDESLVDGVIEVAQVLLGRVEALRRGR